MTKRVLIAECNPACRRSYIEFFTEHGFEIATSGTSDDCLEKLHLFAPDLVFLDAEIAVGVLEHLRTVAPDRQVPVFVTGAKVSPETRRALKVPPVLEFLRKPLDEATLLGCLCAGLLTAKRQHPHATADGPLSMLTAC